jgi:hypothetical protein
LNIIALVLDFYGLHALAPKDRETAPNLETLFRTFNHLASTSFKCVFNE